MNVFFIIATLLVGLIAGALLQAETQLIKKKEKPTSVLSVSEQRRVVDCYGQFEVSRDWLMSHMIFNDKNTDDSLKKSDMVLRALGESVFDEADIAAYHNHHTDRIYVKTRVKVVKKQ